MSRDDTSPAHEARKPTDADRFVGQRLRQGRRELGMTQEALAATLGVTFQQIQKYEAGHSRMSAGRLLEIAVAISASQLVLRTVRDCRKPRHAARARSAGARPETRCAWLVDEIGDIESLQAAVHVLQALALRQR